MFVLKRVKKLVHDSRVDPTDALRLVLLYALRYEKHASCDTVGLLNILKNRGAAVHLVPRILEYAGQHARQGDLFNNVKIMDAVKLTRSLIKVSDIPLCNANLVEIVIFCFIGIERCRECVHPA